MIKVADSVRKKGLAYFHFVTFMGLTVLMISSNNLNKELEVRLIKKIELYLARSKPVTTYAQTNIQLFNQLRLAHYSEADLSYIYDAY